MLSGNVGVKIYISYLDVGKNISEYFCISIIVFFNILTVLTCVMHFTVQELKRREPVSSKILLINSATEA